MEEEEVGSKLEGSMVKLTRGRGLPFPPMFLQTREQISTAAIPVEQSTMIFLNCVQMMN
jgi:hypothetical protein